MDGVANALTDHPLASLAFTFLFVPLFQLAKESQWRWLRWLNDESAVVWNAVAAFFTALGLHFSISHTGDAHIATVAWTTSGVVSGSIEILRQFLANHVGHAGYSTLFSIKRVMSKLEDPAVLTALVKLAQAPPPTGGSGK